MLNIGRQRTRAHRQRIDVAVDGNGINPETFACAHHTNGNLTTIGDENLVEQLRYVITRVFLLRYLVLLQRGRYSEHTLGLNLE